MMKINRIVVSAILILVLLSAMSSFAYGIPVGTNIKISVYESTVNSLSGPVFAQTLLDNGTRLDGYGDGAEFTIAMKAYVANDFGDYIYIATNRAPVDFFYYKEGSNWRRIMGAAGGALTHTGTGLAQADNAFGASARGVRLSTELTGTGGMASEISDTVREITVKIISTASGVSNVTFATETVVAVEFAMIRPFTDDRNSTMIFEQRRFPVQFDPSLTPPGVDAAAPFITAISPANGASGNAITGNISIIFNEVMDETITGTVRLNSLTALTNGTWSNGGTVYTIPYNDLLFDTVYNIHISGFRDIAGNVMTVDSTNSFTTKQAATGTLLVGGVSINLRNSDDRLASAGWQWNANSGTLTLGSNYTGERIYVNCTDKDTIYLTYNGNVSVTGNPGNAAFYCKGNLRINGSGGALSIENTNGGILLADGSITISEGTIEATTTNPVSAAMESYNGSITITGNANVKANGIYGLQAKQVIISTTGTVDITAESYAILVNGGRIDISNGTITAISTRNNNTTVLRGDTSISGGTINLHYTPTGLVDNPIATLYSMTGGRVSFNGGTAPAITSVSPDACSLLGGTSITISGSGFVDGLTQIGLYTNQFASNTEAENITVSNTNTVTFDLRIRIPPGYIQSGETRDIIIQTPDGATGLKDAFAFARKPAFVSAATNTEGTKILVTFDSEMSASELLAGDYTIMSNGVRNLATDIGLNGSNRKILELTLTTPIQNGQAVTIAYTYNMSIHATQAVSGDLLSSFTAQNVTNSVPGSSTGGGGGGGSSSSGGGGGGGGGPVTITGGDGSVSLTYNLSDGAVNLFLLDNEIKNILTASKNGLAVFDLSGVPNGTGVTMSKGKLKEIVDGGLALQFKMSKGTIALDAGAAKSAVTQANGNTISLSLRTIEQSGLTPAQQAAVKPGDLVFNISASSGSQSITHFDGTITVSVPYEGPTPVIVWYLDNAGNLEKIPNTYNAITKMVTFSTNHLSLYVVGSESDDSARIRLTIGSLSYSVSGVTKQMDAAPEIVNDRAMAPLRFIAEAMRAKVDWDADHNTVQVELDGVTFTVKIGEIASGMDVPAMIINDRTMVPLRYISETLGFAVVWNPDNQTIDITK